MQSGLERTLSAAEYLGEWMEMHFSNIKPP